MLTMPPDTAQALLESAAHYHNTHRWFARLFLLMPDHLHALLAFPAEKAMQATLRDWKRYTARILNLNHRLRSNESC